MTTDFDDDDFGLSSSDELEQAMADLADGVELIVGSVRDPRFGPVLMVGLGGILTEVLGDTACALAPVSADAARALLLSLGTASALGFGRFAYGLLLPAMRDDLGWSLTEAGAMNTANGLGYLVGAMAAAAVELNSPSVRPPAACTSSMSSASTSRAQETPMRPGSGSSRATHSWDWRR